jgi:hypothetical protein
MCAPPHARNNEAADCDADEQPVHGQSGHFSASGMAPTFLSQFATSGTMTSTGRLLPTTLLASR